MKTKPTLFTLLIGLLATSHSFAQCFPDPNFASEPLGLYPSSAILMDCSGENANVTIVGVVDTILEINSFPIGPVEYVFDAMRVDSIIGLPAGLSLETDVMGSATQEAPYGAWLYSGTAPNFSPSIGCINITGDPADWAAASTGGANGDGIFQLYLIIDFRFYSSVPDLTPFFPVGSWMQGSGITGEHLDTLEATLFVNESGCGGSLFVFPEVTADNSSSPDCDGEVEVIVYNGAPPFTYTFSTGTTGTSVDTALCAGVYSVQVTDAVGASATSEFAVASTANVYSNVGGGGFWPPIGTDSLFYSYMTCDLDYSLPLDSFYIVDAYTIGPDTCAVTWVVWQQNQPFTVTSFYPFLGLDPTVFSLILWCENGRSEPGIFQLYEFLDLSVGIDEEAEEVKATIYPNPGNGLFTMQLEATDRLSLRVMDVSGRMIMNQQLSGSSLYTIDLQDAPVGVYVMEIETSVGRTFKKLVKN